MKDQDEGREVAVERLQSARRNRHVPQYDAARGSPHELAGYTQLQAAVEQFAAREAWHPWPDGGY